MAPEQTHSHRQPGASRIFLAPHPIIRTPFSFAALSTTSHVMASHPRRERGLEVVSQPLRIARALERVWNEPRIPLRPCRLLAVIMQGLMMIPISMQMIRTRMFLDRLLLPRACDSAAPIAMLAGTVSLTRILSPAIICLLQFSPRFTFHFHLSQLPRRGILRTKFSGVNGYWPNGSCGWRSNLMYGNRPPAPSPCPLATHPTAAGSQSTPRMSRHHPDRRRRR
jgi:hypothetical protein